MSERRANRIDNELIDMVVGDKITPHLKNLEQTRLNAIDAIRYSFVRKLSLRQFSDIYLESMLGINTFDELVDAKITKELK